MLVPLLAPLALASTLESETTWEAAPGVTIVEQVYSDPTNRVHAAKVDLCADGVRLIATEAPSSRRTAASWGASVGATVAVNGDFYRTDLSQVTVYGDAVGGGVQWPSAQTGRDEAYSSDWYYGKYGWIAVGEDWVEFSHTERTKADGAVTLGWYPTTSTFAIPSATEALVSGFPELVVEGVTYSCADPTASTCFPDRSDMRARHPRTAMGLSRDRKTLLLAVVDGRSTSSSGMYGTELAELMADLGAWEAFNLDGGGSSQIWVDGHGTINSPSDGSPRSVANHWGIVATGSGEAGSCHVEGGCYPTPVEGAENATFKDLPPDALGHDAADILYRAGVTEGCATEPDRFFCPACAITRAQLITFLGRAAGWDVSSPPAAPTFTDVPTTAAAYPYVEAAAALGVTSGCGDGLFCPDDPVERAHAAAFLVRAAGWHLRAPSTPTFDDVPASHAFYQEIETLAARCVTSGCGDGAFCPDQTLTRAQAAVFVAKTFDLEDANPCEDTGWETAAEETGTEESGDPPDGSNPRATRSPGGCGCAATGGTGAGWLLALGAVARRRRREGVRPGRDAWCGGRPDRR